ncbi:hypothetical protein EMCRGX_G030599 [Ephydatia muelleri]
MGSVWIQCPRTLVERRGAELKNGEALGNPLGLKPVGPKSGATSTVPATVDPGQIGTPRNMATNLPGMHSCTPANPNAESRWRSVQQQHKYMCEWSVQWYPVCCQGTAGLPVLCHSISVQLVLQTGGTCQSTFVLANNLRTGKSCDILQLFSSPDPIFVITSRKMTLSKFTRTNQICMWSTDTATAFLSKEAAMTCIVAIEEAMVEHYNSQLRELLTTGVGDSALLEVISKCRDEEMEYKDIDIKRGAQSCRDEGVDHKDIGIKHGAESVTGGCLVAFISSITCAVNESFDTGPEFYIPLLGYSLDPCQPSAEAQNNMEFFGKVPNP